MEVIVTRHGEGKLATKTFFSDEKGFNVASVIVMGKKECVLLDCQWTLSNAHRFIAEIIETGLSSKPSFATHGHPPLLGNGGSFQRLPKAKCYMLPEDGYLQRPVSGQAGQVDSIIGENNLCRKQCERLEPLNENFIELEGEPLKSFPTLWRPEVELHCMDPLH